MTRLACLHVSEFLLAAALRVEPELYDSAYVITAGRGPRATVVAASAAAARHGITPGMTTAQAAGLAARLAIRPASPDAARAAQAALCDVATSCSPRIEDAGGGTVYLDLTGLSALFASEAQLASVLAQRALQLGLAAHVGVASSKTAAYLAARAGGGVAVIPAGEEWHFLAPVPLAWLGPSRELAGTLHRWGVHTIGDLAALPTHAIGARVGPEGVQLIRRARGEDDHPLVPRALPLQFEEGIELEYGIETLEPLLFVLRGVLDRLTTRLALRGLVCGDLRLSLGLATRGRDERTIAVAAPSNDSKSLLALARLQLDAHPPAAAIEAVRASAVPERLRPAQLDLFRPRGPAPARLAVTMARLTAICGADRVGAPAVADSHRPDAFGMAPFAPAEVAPQQRTDHGHAAQRVEAVPLAVRALRPPHAVEVFCERDRPEFVRGDAFAGRIVHAAGPWRVYGDWWTDGPCTRDYYDAQLSDGCVYRLYCDLTTQGWFVDGVYD